MGFAGRKRGGERKGEKESGSERHLRRYLIPTREQAKTPSANLLLAQFVGRPIMAAAAFQAAFSIANKSSREAEAG
jgi:hypothetical protein